MRGWRRNDKVGPWEDSLRSPSNVQKSSIFSGHEGEERTNIKGLPPVCGGHIQVRRGYFFYACKLQFVKQLHECQRYSCILAIPMFMILFLIRIGRNKRAGDLRPIDGLLGGSLWGLTSGRVNLGSSHYGMQHVG